MIQLCCVYEDPLSSDKGISTLSSQIQRRQAQVKLCPKAYFFVKIRNTWKYSYFSVKIKIVHGKSETKAVCSEFYSLAEPQLNSFDLLGIEVTNGFSIVLLLSLEYKDEKSNYV